ncbi:MAG: hypothetical protein OXI87_06705 [Albidovulum sp.]|nr:hypothetical protein [Albidovulum sp.]MDE0304559.1 hypothetical protein [Albidovulum sp.]MDE0531467.1 hypothetical protein [Albidovulum sp.]
MARRKPIIWNIDGLPRQGHRRLSALRRIAKHEHAGVYSQYACASLTYDDVEIFVVVETKAACIPKDAGPFFYFGIEDAHVVGVVDQ